MSIRLGDKIIAGCYEVVQGDVYSKIETNELLAEKTNSKDLATVAFTGEYKDLKNIPFIPSDTSDLTNNANFVVNTELENKLNKDLSNCEKPYVIECNHNGNNRYCLWSDGRKEQWGRATTKNITFYTPYTNTDYIFTVAIEAGNIAITNPSDLCYQSKSNVGVVWNTELGTTIKSIEWYACGY